MSVCTVFCRGERADLLAAATALEAAGLETTVGKASVVVRWKAAGPVLTITRRRGVAVRGRAIALGARTPFEADMRTFDGKLEIRIPDLAAALDETNTLILVQGVLHELTGGVLYNGWNGRLYRP